MTSEPTSKPDRRNKAACVERNGIQTPTRSTRHAIGSTAVEAECLIPLIIIVVRISVAAASTEFDFVDNFTTRPGSLFILNSYEQDARHHQGLRTMAPRHSVAWH
jgi:hypothetical protein